MAKKQIDEIALAEQQVADLSQKITTAKADFERTEAAATASALSGDDPDAAVLAAAKAQLMLKAYERAKVQADETVVALRAAKLAAENAARRAEAVKTLHQLRDESIELRRTLVPVIDRIRQICVVHDRVVGEYATHVLRSLFDAMNAALLAPDASREGFDGLANLIARNDGEADRLAGRVLAYKAQ